jgi:hypothetical protein
MRVDVKLTETELIEVTCSTMFPNIQGRKVRMRLSDQFFTEGEAYSLLHKLDHALLKLKMKQRKAKHDTSTKR